MTANWNINTNTRQGTQCPVRVYVPVAGSVSGQESISLQNTGSIVLTIALTKDFMAHTPGGSDG